MNYVAGTNNIATFTQRQQQVRIKLQLHDITSN